ncbi:MAG: Asp-tRNA(Asn)/Glu-tRNA(Gln) amidotransferase subunit GatC [Bifidobacteriaceae bacterium]|jgi:aspartyl-tRNA(Asn)/glutamyl-tRNA(Gln) amidotransferase subunit C|nr:Asp-tRNA(Asn)/Glu-tRNA(Gln) amidotransferase subunit GatC [Bifidobacteriaceae bacterium]
MSVLSRDEVAHLAHLARISLTDQELDLMATQLDAVVDAVAVVQSAVTADTPATSHPLPLTNGWREDVVQPGLSNEAALSSAPREEAGQFRVPQILGEEP